MAMRKLRVYTGPEAGITTRALLGETLRENTVQVTLGDILPLLADAVSSDRTWLSDFSDDEITVSSDLFDVLQAYRHFRRPSA